MEEDYYKILGVEKTATADEIKRAYKKTAIKYHPDKNPGDKQAEEMFKKAAEAYDVLRDPDKRARYDQFGKAGLEGGMGGGFSAEGMDLNDIFSHFGDIFEGMGFGGFGGFGGQRSQPARHQGRDYQIHVRLSLKEMSTGVTKKFKVRKDVGCPTCHGSGCEAGHTAETCPDCHGTGSVLRTQRTMFGMMQSQSVCPTCHGEGQVIKHPCKHCHGTGVTDGEEIVEVKIPAGVAAGMVVNVPGKGGAGRHNGANGNLQVVIEELPDDNFIRDGQDLIYNLLLTVPQATLGDTVEIPTLDGKARVSIKAGTQPGTTLRLRGKGLPAVRGYGYGTGDIIINVSVYIPEEPSRAVKDALAQLIPDASTRPTPSARERLFRTFRNYFKS